MEEIKVGEYVRTDKGYIVKIDKEKKNLQMLKFLDVEYGNKVKHSPNIIDLIEEGDYVNGHKILEIKRNVENGLKYLYYEYVPMKFYKERTDKIKSIVTKEMMKSVEYTIE